MTFIQFEHKKTPQFHLIQEMSLRHVAWNYSLTRHLRKQDPIKDLQGLISDEEIEKLNVKFNIPNASLYTQAEKLKNAHRDNLLDAYQFVQRPYLN